MNNCDALKVFFKENKRYKKNTKIAYEIAINQFFEYFPINFSHVTRDNIKQYKEFLIKNMSESSVALKIHALKAYFKYLFLKGFISTNPSLSITCPKIPEDVPQIITEDRFFLLCEAAKDNLRDRAIFALLSMGVRVSELINIKTEHINWNKRTISMFVVR